MKNFSALFIAASLFLFSSLSYAQDQKTITNESLGVSVTAPDNWEVSQNSEKAVANFKQVGAQGQIEVVGTKLMTPDVADVFFTTFHKTLTESDFKKVSSEETKIGDKDGLKTVYTFEHSGVTLNIYVFQFLKSSTAWLVVGYVPDSEKEKFEEPYNKVIESMKINN